MKDYKELIKNINGDAAFRHILSECGADGRVWFDKRFICDYVSRLKHVVEQLVKKLGEARNELGKALADARHAEEYAWEVKQERDALAKSLDQTLVRLNDETVRADRLEAENRAKEQYIAETIGKVIKERDAAIADLKDMHRKYLVDGKGKCFACKNDVFDCDKRACAGCDYTDNFEWRGVQEAEHETD